MQAATHLAAGAVLARALPRHAYWAAALAMLSHPLLDDLALATYHPPDPLPDDPFWVGFHGLVVIATLLTAWAFRRHAWILLAAMVPDLDWFVGRPLGLWEPGALHEAFRSIPGLASVSVWLRDVVPDLRTAWAAAGIEVGLYAGLVALAGWLGPQGRRPPADPHPAD